MARRDMQVALRRAVQVGLGTAAGLALWALAESWQSPALPPAIYLALFVFLLVQSGTALVLAGPFHTRRALGGALALSLPVTALAVLAGIRYATPTGFLDDPVMLAVLTVLVVFAVPFLSVWMRARQDWLDYAALFRSAWTVVVRYLAGWAFVAAFWMVAYLSARLLGLVGIEAVERLLGLAPVRFGLTGAMLGMGLAVAYELRDTINPFLILRLLRLLLPLVLAVVAVFLGAVPFRGLTQLFGEFSAAGPLIATSMVAITLISTALDETDDKAVSTRGLRAATRALALLTPLLAGLAVWAVALRVRQYGWTPDRVLAGSVATVLLAYGLGYAIAALRHGWTGRVRGVNVAMALVVISGAALWMTPLLDAFRISASSQVQRYVEGRAAPEDLPLWQMAHDWGRAGRDAVARLAALADDSGDGELARLTGLVRDNPDPFHYRQAAERLRLPEAAAELARLMPVRPETAAALLADFAALPTINRDQWLAGCRRNLPDGRPGCVMVTGPFLPARDSDGQAIVLYLDDAGGVRGNHVLRRRSGELSVRVIYDPVDDTWPTLPADAIARALDGAFRIAPAGTQALWLGDAVLVPGH